MERVSRVDFVDCAAERGGPGKMEIYAIPSA